MRIAWIGQIAETGGVPTMGLMLVRGMLARGIEVDLFGFAPEEQVRALLGNHPNMQYSRTLHNWEYDRWYSRTPTLTFLSNFYTRAKSHARLCKTLVERHKARRYDCVLQFSQMELLELGKHLDQLPPVLVYPCVHAAGELTWHRKESAYARQSESSIRHWSARAMLWYRSRVQRRESHKPAVMIGMSKRFNELMNQDYGLPMERMRVLYHPIAPAKDFHPSPLPGRKLKLVFAGRMSVRKGVEMLIELSRRLDDLKDEVEFALIGGHTQWSDYRKHLSELNPNIARYLGPKTNSQLIETFAVSDILVIPSHYEPGGLVVGEAVSRGMCVVASDEVGSAEPLSGAFVEKFPAGDMDAFERATRTMIARAKADRAALAEAAHAAADVHFAPDKIAGDLISILQEAAAT